MNALFGNVPKTNMKKAILILIMNILIPGSGTILLGCTSKPKNNDLIKTGVFQFIAAVFVIGWIWSIWWGVELIKKAAEEEEEEARRKVEEYKEPFNKAEDAEKQKKKVEEAKNAEGNNDANVV